MLTRVLKIAFVAMQVAWMVAILPGHVRGMIVFGGAAAGGSADSCCAPPPPVATTQPESPCCATDAAPPAPHSDTHNDTPSPERQQKCAVCYQAHGYTLPPVFDIDLAPAGLCELRRLIEPSKLHQLLCDLTYYANGPPRSVA